MTATRSRIRVVAFVVVAVACLLGGVVAVLVGARGKSAERTSAKVGVVGRGVTVQVARDVRAADKPTSPHPPPVPVSERGIEAGATAPAPPHAGTLRPVTLVARAQNPSNPRLNGAVTSVPIGGRAATTADSVFCERLAFTGSRGICLTTLGVSSQVAILDRHLHTLFTVGIPGVPSRARISSDGRYAAVTTFVVGHAYAAPGTFSTYTALIDVRRGKVIANLEQFATIRDGRVVDAPDVNYWGITFAGDDRHFYATMATGGKTYLVYGDMLRREMWTLHENVECPSLSPDGTRIAFKKLVGDHGDWHFYVLDLRTMREHPLAEQRSIDDQVEWLDNDHVLYSDGYDVWSAPADGGGDPHRLLTHAASPSVIWSS